jgi:hypothetical protein
MLKPPLKSPGEVISDQCSFLMTTSHFILNSSRDKVRQNQLTLQLGELAKVSRELGRWRNG